jgi:hypothetical protein
MFEAKDREDPSKNLKLTKGEDFDSLLGLTSFCFFSFRLYFIIYFGGSL